jgi:hypothetical protein
MQVKFVLDEDRTNAHFEVFGNPLEYQFFGTTRVKNWNSVSFLILPLNADIPYEYLENRQVPEKYGFFVPKIGYLHVYFKASGFYSETDGVKGLIEGWLSTNSENAESIAIFKAIKKIVRKNWRLIQYAYFGPRALEFMEQGGIVGQDLNHPIGFRSFIEPNSRK